MVQTENIAQHPAIEPYEDYLSSLGFKKKEDNVSFSVTNENNTISFILHFSEAVGIHAKYVVNCDKQNIKTNTFCRNVSSWMINKIEDLNVLFQNQTDLYAVSIGQF